MNKPLLIALLAALLTAAAATGNAAEDMSTATATTPRPGIKLKLRTDFWYHLAATPAYIFWETNVHEGTHALTAMAYGYEVKSYKPYPHLYTDRDGQRYFTTGKVVLDDMPEKSGVGVIALTPAAIGITTFVVSDFALASVDHDSAVAPFLLFGGMFWPYAQFAWSTLSPGETDLSLMSDSFGINRGVTTTLAVTLTLVGTGRLAYRGYQVLMTEDCPRKETGSLMVIPTVSAQTQGLSVFGTF